MLREPRRGVAGLAEWVDTDADGAVERVTVQESQDCVELAGCSNGHRSVAPVQDSRKRCEMVLDAWSVAAAQGSEREHLLVAKGASAPKDVSSPTERSIGRFFVSRVAGATTLGRSVACRTFQRFRIKLKLNAFLIDREC